MSEAKRAKYRNLSLGFFSLVALYNIYYAIVFRTGFDFLNGVSCWYVSLPCCLCIFSLLYKAPMRKSLFLVALILFALGYGMDLFSRLGYYIEDYIIPIVISSALSLLLFACLLIARISNKVRQSSLLCIIGVAMYPLLNLISHIWLSIRFSSSHYMLYYFDIQNLLRIVANILLWLGLLFISKYNLIPLEDCVQQNEETDGGQAIIDILRNLKADYENGTISEAEYKRRKEEFIKMI